MPSLSEKLSMYINQTHTSPSTVARWLSVSPVKISQLQAGQPVDLTADHYRRLAEETGIAESIWQSDQLALPDDLTPAKRGRKAREETPDFLRTQNLRRNRLQQLINTRFEQSKSAFAKAINKDESAVSHYLKRRTITDAFCLHVAKAINVSATWLMSGTGSPDDVEAAPLPTAHQGALLGRYLEEHNITNRQLGILMGYPEGSASGSVGQFRKSRQLSPDVRAKIASALNMPEVLLFSPKSNTKSNNSYELTLNQDVNRSLPTHSRVSPASASSLRTVQLTQIPAFLRHGFHYDKYMPEAPTTIVPLETLRRAQNPNLTPEQVKEIIDKYASIIIGTDYMEPSLLPGYQVTMYQFEPNEWGEENGVMAIQTTAGRLFLGRVTDNKLVQTGSITLTCDNSNGGSLTVERDQIAYLWKLETFIGQVI
jgi:transcriptional regulator with XRE-family HTH domain